MSTCLFCNIEPERIITTTDLSFVIADSFPVTPGHSLVIPKRHVVDCFGLTEDELLDFNRLVKERSAQLQSEDASIEGFNIGANAGRAAGQTVMHCHIHLIPRRPGDMADPRGGVRGVIPDKQKYSP